MMHLGIYCAGNLGKELYDIAIRINEREKRWEAIVFIDDIFEADSFYGTEVHRPEVFRQKLNDIEIIIADGTPVERKLIRDKIDTYGFHLINLIDPTAIISPTAKLGRGIIVTPFSTISSNVVLHDNVLVQSYVRIGHDIEIGEDSVISSNVGIGGGAKVGSQTYVGMGAVVKNELKIGSNSIISMGAVVHTDIDDEVTVVGLPARVSKKNIDGKIFK